MARSLFLPPTPMLAALSPWSKSVMLVASLHLGAAGLVSARVLLAPENDAVAGAESFIEFAPVVSSAESEFAPEAAQNNAEEKQAAPGLEETLSQKRERDLPTEQASPTNPDEQDLRMAQERTARESEKQSELQTTEAMVEQKQEVASQASQAAEAAPEQVGEDRKELSAAPDEGNAQEAQRQIEAWQRQIFAHIVRHKRYPEQARAGRLKGETLVAFTLDSDGKVSNLRISRSSGSTLLDQAAISVLQRANPLPKPPVQMARGPLDFAIPMRFAAK